MNLNKPLRVRREKDLLCEYDHLPVAKKYAGLYISDIEHYFTDYLIYFVEVVGLAQTKLTPTISRKDVDRLLENY